MANSTAALPFSIGAQTLHPQKHWMQTAVNRLAPTWMLPPYEKPRMRQLARVDLRFREDSHASTSSPCNSAARLAARFVVSSYKSGCSVLSLVSAFAAFVCSAISASRSAQALMSAR
jgi:hypothetical protein